MYKNENFNGPIKPNELLTTMRLSAAFKNSWGKDTAYPDDAEKWTEKNPSLGQCAVTSLVVQGYLDGSIQRNMQYHHYWNHLESGASVDFTHAQFNIGAPIISEGNVETEDLLYGEKADKAKTKERCSRLKERVRIEMEGQQATLFLLSSNARPEYIHDIIETMGVPKGTVKHFRYMLRYIDDSLGKLIPVKDSKEEKDSNYLVGAETLIIYLKQEEINKGEFQWENTLPIRNATLKHCYKTGEEDTSIVNFFFEVHDSILKTDRYDEDLKAVFGSNYGKGYAFVTFEDTIKMVTKHEPREIFEKQCIKFSEVGLDFKSKHKPIIYEPPLMVLFEGLFDEKENIICPKYDPYRHKPKSYFSLKEGESYHYKFQTYTWDHSKPHKVKLTIPKPLFSTTDEYVLVSNSPYDNECWELVTSFVDQGTKGSMVLEVESKKDNNKTSGSIELDWKIITSFKLKRKILLIVLDSLTDLLFALGPVLLVIVKFVDNSKSKPYWFEFWPYSLGSIYITWIILKSLRRFISRD